MCIPHGATGSTDSGYVDVKPKKHVKKVPQGEFEKGDPSFIDERVVENKNNKVKKSFFNSLFDD